MKYIKSMTILLIAMSFAFAGCIHQESQNSDSTSDNIEQETILSVSLGGSSRSERFLGSFDQINRLALDIDRQYGNKRIATDLELTYDNASGNWEGTVNNLIVGFDYTITGHAYRAFDNASDDFVETFDPNGDNSTVFVEIFTGSTDHPVIDGVNTLDLRLSPILDSRTLSVPKITHIYRPFQMVASTSDNITVKVETVSKSGSNATDEDLSYRFRSVDNNSMPLSSNLGGTFSPSQDVIEHQSGGNYPDIVTTYNAPDNRSSQKIQIRVSNEQEIGITQHFTINVTDDLDVVHTVDTNPVVESFTVERISDTRLKFIVNASNDDGFSDLTYKWEYLFGDDRYFNEDTATEESSGSPRGILEAVMYDYQDTDAGMVVLTVCEDGGKTGADGNPIPVNCAFMNEASTSMSFELIPNAYQQPIICDVGNDCASEFDNSWIACDTNNGKFGSLPFAAQRISMVFGSGKGTRTEQYTTDSTCTDDSAIQITQIFDGVWTSEDNVTQVKYSYDNTSMVEAKRGTFTIDSVHLRIDNISLLGDLGTNICGIGNWIGQTHDVTGCDDGKFEYFDNGTVIKSIARVENDVFRWDAIDNSSPSYPNYPDTLGCNQFGLESNGSYLTPISNSSSCKDSDSDHSHAWVPFNSLTATESGTLDLTWSSQSSQTYSLSGSYSTNCSNTDGSSWGGTAGQNYPVGMQSHRVATVFTSVDSISNEYYYFSNDNCSYDHLIAAEIRTYDSIVKESDNSSVIVMKSQEVEANLLIGDQNGADYFNYNWGGSFGPNYPDNMSYPDRDNYTISQSGSSKNIWIPYDNDSFKEAWWTDGSVEDLLSNHRCLYRNGQGSCSYSN